LTESDARNIVRSLTPLNFDLQGVIRQKPFAGNRGAAFSKGTPWHPVFIRSKSLRRAFPRTPASRSLIPYFLWTTPHILISRLPTTERRPSGFRGRSRATVNRRRSFSTQRENFPTTASSTRTWRAPSPSPQKAKSAARRDATGAGRRQEDRGQASLIGVKKQNLETQRKRRKQRIFGGLSRNQG